MDYASKMLLINNLRLFGTALKMTFLIFNSDTYSLRVTKRSSVAAALILNIFILSIMFISLNQYVFAKNNLTETDSTDYFQFNDSVYKIPTTALEVKLVTGWNGVNLGSFILTSPGGLDAKTGETVEKIPVFMTVGYFSPKSVFKDYNATDLNQFVQQSAKTTKCAVPDNGTVRINGFNGYKIRMTCDSNKSEEDNILNYYFFSNGKVVYLSLKGTNPYFFRNIENFEKSANTIRAVH